MKVFIVGGGGQYATMFRNRGWEITHRLEETDLLQFTGGEDVSPVLYGEENTTSYNSWERDVREAGYFAIGKRMCIPMAGICRGGQFLNVMCGGSMIQHVEGHAIHGTHLVQDFLTKDFISVTSTHHQMMVMGKSAYFVAGASLLPGSWSNDVEVLHYPASKVLCFQPHPEFGGYQQCTDYYFELLGRCLGLGESS